MHQNCKLSTDALIIPSLGEKYYFPALKTQPMELNYHLAYPNNKSNKTHAPEIPILYSNLLERIPKTE